MIEIISEFSFIQFLLKCNYIILFILFLLNCFSFGLALYLEKILCSENKIIISGPSYNILIKYENIKKIVVTPYYQYKNFRGEGGTFREYFKSKCTIIFITKDNEEYEWGYSLSYQKGMEIKKIIEDRINLELNKNNKERKL